MNTDVLILSSVANAAFEADRVEKIARLQQKLKAELSGAGILKIIETLRLQKFDVSTEVFVDQLRDKDHYDVSGQSKVSAMLKFQKNREFFNIWLETDTLNEGVRYLSVRSDKKTVKGAHDFCASIHFDETKADTLGDVYPALQNWLNDHPELAEPEAEVKKRPLLERLFA